MARKGFESHGPETKGSSGEVWKGLERCGAECRGAAVWDRNERESHPMVVTGLTRRGSKGQDGYDMGRRRGAGNGLVELG
jgi:hypothetical protein